VRAWERERSALEFEQLADRMAQALRITLSDHLEVLYAIEGFYASSPEIERQEFHAFVKRALARHHSIQALSWNPQVTDAERAAFEEAARREGYSDFRITEQYAPGQMMRAAQRPEYVPVYYIEPYRGNELALGFDVASDPVRREALDRACDTGAPIASGWIALVQVGGDRSGVAVYLPIYRSGSPPETLAERRRDLQGYAAGVFRIDALIEAALQDLERAGIEIRLYDDAAAAEERLLYVYGAKERNVSSPAVNAAQGEASAGQALQSSSSLDVAGRRWTFTFVPTPEYLARHPPWQAWTVLASGLLFTSLLGAFLLVVTGRSSLIEQLVVQRTAELSAALQEKATLLQEVHQRVKNNLQIISSLLNLQVAYAPDPRLGVLFAESQSRVRAMALIHQLLYERKDFSRVHLGEYLERLGRLLASSYGVKEKRVALRVEADEVYIKLDRAVPCGLLVNELVMNAFKHAFPPPPSPSPLVRTPTPSLPRDQGGGEGVGDRLAYGEIRIELRTAKGEAVLTVSDNGVGLPAGLDPAKAQSLGLQLVAVLTDQIGGTLAVRSGPGTRFDLHFPLGVGENKIS
jgi:two-component sensor histidine kinase